MFLVEPLEHRLTKVSSYCGATVVGGHYVPSGAPGNTD